MSPLWLCKVCAVFSVNCLICDRYTLLIIGTEKIVHVRCTVRAINFHHNWLWKIQSSLFSYSFSSVTYSSFSSSTSPPSESAPPSPPPSPVHPNWIHQLLVVWYRNFVYLEFGTLAEFDSDFFGCLLYLTFFESLSVLTGALTCIWVFLQFDSLLRPRERVVDFDFLKVCFGKNLVFLEVWCFLSYLGIYCARVWRFGDGFVFVSSSRRCEGLAMI